MTATLEHTPIDAELLGDEALAIIDAFRSDLDDNFRVSPLETEFPRLNQELGATGVYLAYADDNIAGSFKWRGALVGAAELQRQGYDSINTFSAGNALGGAVLAGRLLGLRAVHGVVPDTAPESKKRRARSLDPSQRFQLHIAGHNLEEAAAWAKAQSDLGALLHAYDNPYVAAGQGTLVDDTLAAHPTTRHIVLPSGGGGLVSGTLGRLDELGRTDVMVHAVEGPGNHSLSRSMDAGSLQAVEATNPRYGGLAVRKIGQHAYDLCRRFYGQQLNIISDLTDQEVSNVIEDYDQDRHDYLRLDTPNFEPTSMVAMAGLSRVVEAYPDEDIVVFGTGHNEQLRPEKKYRIVH